MYRLLFFFAVLLFFSNCKKQHSDSGGPNSFILIDDTAGIHDTAFTPRNNGYSYDDSITKMFIPNAFTPNGDGMNDGYAPFGNVSYFNMTIKSLSGAVLFYSTDSSHPWNGRDSSGVIKQGYYIANISFANSRGVTYMYVLYINLYYFVSPNCLTRNAMNCKFGDMIEPRYGFIYPTTETFCP